MVLTDARLKAKIDDFKSAVAPDLFSPKDIVDFDSAEREVASLAPVADKLEELAAGGVPYQRLAETILATPEVYRALCAFLSIATDVVLEDGRRLPRPSMPPTTMAAADDAAAIFVELGVEKLLSPGVDAGKLLLLAHIYEDANKRRFRVDAKIAKRVATAVADAVEKVAASGLAIEVGSPNSIPARLRRMVEFVVLVAGSPRVVVANTFQSHGGGRQTRELTATYPTLAKDAESLGLQLVLIADGRGMREMSDRTLRILFESVPHTMTFSQAENGLLEAALSEIAATMPYVPAKDDAAVDRLIETALSVATAMKATDLPLPENAARLALARYVSSRPKLGLKIDAAASEVSWTRDSVVAQLQSIQNNFSASAATKIVGELFGGTETLVLEDSSLSVRVFEAKEAYFQVIGVGAQFYAPSADELRDLAKEVLQGGLSCRLAILVVEESISPWIESVVRDAQASLPVPVVVLTLDQCVEIARATEAPQSALQEIALKQSDLTKLSPFVVRGVAPDRVFFGREEEEATLLSTLATNSVALLGGRRIGKTSLLRHSASRLRSADLTPFFGDCQVVKTWSDFGALATRNWPVTVNSPFVPSDLFQLVEQLREVAGGNIVILLDEIDQLLDWDRRHTDDDVPEAFFRACRSISQQGLAQFVFSGERTIAERIWDPASPHWNFCRPLMLRQLTQTAAASLILEPLKELGVRIDTDDAVANACWIRTDGHPELVQVVGDGIVSLVNRRSRHDIYCDADDVDEVTSSFEFAEQYLETYWGQATLLEKLLSTALQTRSNSIEFFYSFLATNQVITDPAEVQRGLRMLELYGIAEQDALGYSKRLQWFDSAAEFYGGVAAVRDRFVKELRK